MTMMPRPMWFAVGCAIGFVNVDPMSASEAKPVAPMAAATVQDLVAKVKPSIVVVTFTGRENDRQGLGSGFIVSPDGLIATNLHVIGEARPISVQLSDGRKFDVTAIEAT